MHQYQISLDNSPKKFPCPNCGKKRFVRYKDSETGKYLASDVGRCDRESSCGHHYTPKEYFTDNPDKGNGADWKQATKPIDASPVKPVATIPETIFQATLKAYQANYFAQYLNFTFGSIKAGQLIDRFHIGTSKRWNGATLFWQMDIDGNLRQAKAMLYDPTTGKRRKDGIFVNFLGKKILGDDDANLVQCFFGEHQISSDPIGKPIAIVESEKTAILMTAIFPKYIWLATGGSNGASWDKWKVAKVLKGKDIVLFPDLNCWNEWNKKAQKLKPICKSVQVSRLIQDKATAQEIAQGLDIADFFDFEDSPNWTTEERFTRFDGLKYSLVINQHGYPASWDE